MKLISLSKSTRKNKKYVAEFKFADGKIKKVHFGAAGYQDYTTHHDKMRRESYRSRHASGKTAPPDTANALSFYILWGDSTSLQENKKDFIKKFKL